VWGGGRVGRGAVRGADRQLSVLVSWSACAQLSPSYHGVCRYCLGAGFYSPVHEFFFFFFLLTARRPTPHFLYDKGDFFITIFFFTVTHTTRQQYIHTKKKTGTKAAFYPSHCLWRTIGLFSRPVGEKTMENKIKRTGFTVAPCMVPQQHCT
jgi:hypothetical protein